MAEETPSPADAVPDTVSSDAPIETAPVEASPARRGGRWRKWRPSPRLRQTARGVVFVLLALVAACLVWSVTFDLGPVLRARLETEASAWLNRPVHIGRLSMYLWPGRFLIEDIVIEGLEPEHEPFFTGAEVVISTSWLALLQGEVLVDAVDLRGWRMVTESLPDGHQSFPRFVARRSDVGGDAEEQVSPGPEDTASDGSAQRIVTTVQYLRAREGEFVFRDHDMPWSIVARELDLTLGKQERYGGTVSFRGGTVAIRDFLPMTAAMDADYVLDGGQVSLTRVALSLDGIEAAITGEVDLLDWPSQTYRIVEADLDLPTNKEVFFADDPFTLGGTARFVGDWRIFAGGHAMTGSFRTASWELSRLTLDDTVAAVMWTSDRFEVSDAVAGLYGGNVGVGFVMAPLSGDQPGAARLQLAVREADLAALTEAAGLVGIRPEGALAGRQVLRWPVGRFGEYEGEGELRVGPPGSDLQGDSDAADVVQPASAGAAVPFEPLGPPWRVPLRGVINYTVGPEWIELAPSQLATSATRIAFEGRTAFGDRSRIPFHVTSSDWQESDRLMAAVLTAFGAPTREMTVAGHGEVRGVMYGAIRDPRIEARFDGEDLFGWNVGWGAGTGHIVVENAYLNVQDAVFDQGASLLTVNGRFALGYPRTDGGEEIDARFVLDALPARQVLDAFKLEGYEIGGPLTGEIDLRGQYGRPFGSGALEMVQPVAWGEPFDSASARLRFDGDGVRLDGLRIDKESGVLTGAMFIRWDGTYSFNLDGRDLTMASIASWRYPQVPLDGSAQFTAAGAGAFAAPRYEIRASIRDFGIRGETVGQITGRADVADGVMRVVLEAASPELAVSGSGQIELAGQYPADLTLRFTNTTVDPFARAYTTAWPAEVSALLSGALELRGPLLEVPAITMAATVDQLRLELFEYTVRNENPIRLEVADHVVHVEEMRLGGEGTSLAVSGHFDLRGEPVELRADGDMSLAILPGFFPDLRSSGSARLAAEIRGTVERPVIVGTASVASARVRHFALPHAFDELEGRIVFEPGGVRFDELTGRFAGAPVQFGGRLGIGGYALTELNLTAEAAGMRLRFPEGVRSVVDARLTLGGDLDEAILSGTATVRDAVWIDLFEPASGWLDFAADDAAAAPPAEDPPVPLRLDVRVEAPSSLRINDSTARIVASADLAVGGTFRQPVLFGSIEIDRGTVFFEGNRYRVTRGRIGFSDRTAIVPHLDIEVETDIRVPAQTYRVTLGVSGSMGRLDRLDIDVSSDPPLRETEIFSLLLGDVRDPQAAEIRSLRAREAARQELLQVGAARLLTSPLSAGIGRVVEESFGVDSFEIAPTLSDPSAQHATQLLPTARVLIGKRISDRAHMIFSRAVSGPDQDLIVVLEYDQTDRLSWIVSQNPDRTYALDFRVRHAF